MVPHVGHEVVGRAPPSCFAATPTRYAHRVVADGHWFKVKVNDSSGGRGLRRSASNGGMGRGTRGEEIRRGESAIDPLFEVGGSF